MKEFWLLAAVVALAGCGGNDSPPGPVAGEALSVSIATETGWEGFRRVAQVRGTVRNVGTETSRGFIYTAYDGGAGVTPGEDNVLICQKTFPFVGTDNVGGANMIFAWPERYPDRTAECADGVDEHQLLPDGDGFCDNAAEHPDLDCARPAWRILKIPIAGYAMGGGTLKPGETTMWATAYFYPGPGTYRPSVAVYRWDGTLLDNDARTITLQ